MEDKENKKKKDYSIYWRLVLAVLFLVLVYVVLLMVPAAVLYAVLSSLEIAIGFWASVGIVFLVYFVWGLFKNIK